MDKNSNLNNPKRRSTYAVLFYINRTKTRKDGMCQLLCKISIDAAWEQVGTKVSVNPNIWNPETGRANGRTRNAVEVNKAIDILTERIKVHYTDIKLKQGFVSAELVKNALKGIAQKPLSLIKLFEEHNEEYKKRVGVDRGKASYDTYVLSCKHLLSFLRDKYETDDILLRSLDMKFIDAYDLYLRKEKGMMQKTLHQHVYILKKMTKRAVSQGTLRRDPYMKYHPKLPPLKSRHLKIEELELLIQKQIDTPNLQRIRDWFIFSTFTGLCYADLKRLSVEHIKCHEDGSRWIEMKRQKTGTDTIVRLLDIPLQIIEKYSHERKSDKIFNVYSRTYLIKLIRKLGEEYGIGDITFHKARHNFGTHITLSMGVPIETVSRMMGHKRISTTQIYAKVTDTKVSEDMKKLSQRTRGTDITLHEDGNLRAAIRFPNSVKSTNSNTQKTNPL